MGIRIKTAIELTVKDIPKDAFNPEKVKQISAIYPPFQFQVKRLLEAGRGFYMNETLIAYSIFYVIKPSNRLFVEFISVSEEYRGRGIGTAIFEYFADLCLRENLSGILCEYRRENTRLKGFYKKLQRKINNLKCKRI